MGDIDRRDVRQSREGMPGVPERRTRNPGHLPNSRNQSTERGTGDKRRIQGNPQVRRGEAARKRRRQKRRRRNIALTIFILFTLVVAGIGALFLWQRFGSTTEKADLNQYFGTTSDSDLAVIINQAVMKDLDNGRGTGGRLIDGVPYLEFDLVRRNINPRFYWDANENLLLYTQPTGTVRVEVGSRDFLNINTTETENFTILRTEGRIAYVAVEFVQRFSNMEFDLYTEPNRLVINSEWGDKQVAEVRRDAPLRVLAGPQSPVLTIMSQGDQVFVRDTVGDWNEVATKDGFIGYVLTSSLRRQETQTFTREFTEPEWTNMSFGRPVNLTWHQMENSAANANILNVLAGTKGVNVISPSWFSVADVNGNLDSIGSAEYVQLANSQGVDVWVKFRDFHGGISSFGETFELLSFTSRRENLVNQVIAEAIRLGVNGINLDFELVNVDAGVHFVQFVRELSVRMRQNNLIFSIANFVPQPFNAFYNLREQGIVADYIILMGYDEYVASSPEPGPVASYPFVRGGVMTALEQGVPPEKLINAIPFYARLWHVTPKDEAQLAEEAGTDAAQFPNNVTSQALGMAAVMNTINNAGAEVVWDEAVGANFATWEADGGTYKIWIEDAQSLEKKLQLIHEFNLAGVASWRVGLETSNIWDLILQFVN